MWLTAGLLIVAIAGLCTFLFKSLVQQGSWATTTETKDAAEVRQASREGLFTETVSGVGAAERGPSPKEWWVNADYFWIVLCKNEQFHGGSDPFYSHKIPLGQTDKFSQVPVDKPFTARCDSCGHECVYMPSDVMRWEMQVLEDFVPHPLFRTW